MGTPLTDLQLVKWSAGPGYITLTGQQDRLVVISTAGDDADRTFPGSLRDAQDVCDAHNAALAEIRGLRVVLKQIADNSGGHGNLDQLQFTLRVIGDLSRGALGIKEDDES